MEAKKILCESMVLSQFNFCDVAYLSIDIYLQKKIQKIQNLCLRFISDINRRNDHNYNYDVLRANINWLSMNQRRVSHGLVMMFKILNNLAPTYLKDLFTQNRDMALRSTRSYEGNIWIPNSNYKAIHLKSFRLYIAKVWNQLPNQVKSSVSVSSFKNKIKTLFLNDSLVLPPH